MFAPVVRPDGPSKRLIGSLAWQRGRGVVCFSMLEAYQRGTAALHVVPAVHSVVVPHLVAGVHPAAVRSREMSIRTPAAHVKRLGEVVFTSAACVGPSSHTKIDAEQRMDDIRAARLILIGGSPWVGKSACAEILFSSLKNAAWLDGDDVWRVNPFRLSDPRLRNSDRNMSFVLNTYLESDFDSVIFSSVVLTDESIGEGIVDAIAYRPFERFLFMLYCSEAALAERSLARDGVVPDLRFLYAGRSRRAIHIDTSNSTPSEVAAMMLRHIEAPEAYGLVRCERSGGYEWVQEPAGLAGEPSVSKQSSFAADGPECKNTCVYLIGFPGSGKLTIARELTREFPSLLVDNHFVNNVIFSLIDPDGRTKLQPEVWQNVSRVRDAVFDTIATIAQPDRNFVFTHALVDGDERDHRLFDRVRALAQGRRAAFFVFRILVEAEEICRRISMPDRRLRLKDIDVDAARQRSAAEKVLVPRDAPYHDIDVTSLSAREAAATIMEILRTRAGGAG